MEENTVHDQLWNRLEDVIKDRLANCEDAFEFSPDFTLEDLDELPILVQALAVHGYIDSSFSPGAVKMVFGPEGEE